MLKIPDGTKIFVCMEAVRQSKYVSKDAYNLAKSTLSYPAPGVVISNDTFEAIKTSIDYEVSSSASGCGPCGGGSSELGTGFPTLKISRIHRITGCSFESQ